MGGVESPQGSFKQTEGKVNALASSVGNTTQLCKVHVSRSVTFTVKTPDKGHTHLQLVTNAVLGIILRVVIVPDFGEQLEAFVFYFFY